MTVMIALIGGQPLPNLLPVRHYKPEAVLLVYTDAMQHIYDRLLRTLQGDTLVYGMNADAYDIAAIERQIEQKLRDEQLVNRLR
ncbi:MAG: hypothetical protein HGA19_21445 [Oscillochloris sp.]|nr:hypothetical protein [Oscillochloris sp.]